MATIKRVRVLWGGIAALPGYSIFYSTSTSDVTTDLATFFNAVKSFFPPPLQWSIPAAGDTLDDGTGAINGSWAGTGAIVAAPAGSPSYAAGVGGWIHWNTNAIVGRRRLQGRTFLTPLVTGCFDTGGTITNANLTTMQTAAAALAAAGKLVIWSRPVATPSRAGSSSLVVSATMPDQVTALRTRRY